MEWQAPALEGIRGFSALKALCFLMLSIKLLYP
jgi:hypothetical protein